MRVYIDTFSIPETEITLLGSIYRPTELVNEDEGDDAPNDRSCEGGLPSG